jgi:hypothetical protein
MKDEGLDQGVNPDSTVNKFVGKKEVQFWSSEFTAKE